MFGDYETAKLAALSVLFVFLVIAAVVIAARDARRQRLERQRRIDRQVELLKRARAEAERQRRQETQAGNVDFETGSFRPSDFVVSDPTPESDSRRYHAGAVDGAGPRTFNAA